MAQEKDRLDAGLRNLDHYKIRLPKWRYYIRERLLPVVRWETPYVAWFQETLRSPALDNYFSMAANLGTHTAFMAVLPMLFWCGQTSMGRAMTHMLAAGVYLSGFVKDMLCLPRPLSPPLQRITMSGSASLEYGFPSTHSTNAVSVAVYALFLLRSSEEPHTTLNLVLQVLCYSYAASIVLGRLYCGMHGFFDVIVGSLLGGAIAWVQIVYGDVFDSFLYGGDVRRLVLVELIMCVLIRIHPEPADDCPCYDDSVAFLSVVIGINLGNWHFATTEFARDLPSIATVPFDAEQLGWLKVAARIFVGVAIVFAWRAVMKPAMLTILPPIFRVIEHYGLTLPRRFFTPASQYETVPKQKDDDNVIPRVRDIPGILNNLRRRRAISIGPQSEADAYEALAMREKHRRDSLTLGTSRALSPTAVSQPDYFRAKDTPNGPAVEGRRRRSSSLKQFREQMGMAGEAVPSVAVGDDTPGHVTFDNPFTVTQQEARLLFANVKTPRVRYDVEVVTKLIVYTGIAWLATEGNPLIFELSGLGVR